MDPGYFRGRGGYADSDQSSSVMGAPYNRYGGVGGPGGGDKGSPDSPTAGTHSMSETVSASLKRNDSWDEKAFLATNNKNVSQEFSQYRL